MVLEVSQEDSEGWERGDERGEELVREGEKKEERGEEKVGGRERGKLTELGENMASSFFRVIK